MRIDIVTLFPDMYWSPLDESIVARARKKGIVEINIVNLRDYAHDAYRKVDDKPYGGGAGMLMKPEPLFEAVGDIDPNGEARVILLTPQGRRFQQKAAWKLAREERLLFICGHYEGVDERVRQVLVDEEISIGDFVLTNGNLGALILTDAIVRLLPGALGSFESALNESFDEKAMLDFPQYTRPEEFRGMRVPDVLLSGDHERVETWRREQRRIRTTARRPDLLVHDKVWRAGNEHSGKNS